MARVLKNWDVSSLYPNLVRIFGYSSRNQSNETAYTDILSLRMDAKHKKADPELLKELNVTNGDLKIGLKLPINAYTGTLRAPFNKLYDPLQGFSICTTGQLLILQLIRDLQKIPTLEMVEANTDAVKYLIDEEYVLQAEDILHKWEKRTGLELEEDNIVKTCMANVNNYCEIVQTGDNDYAVTYKGNNFKGKHKFTWNKEKKIFEYSFDDEIEANSFTIVSEALLKNLLFDIPIEETINNCNDIFRFQIITHLGPTYSKMVQESENGDIELQKNNRIYAGLKKSGAIIKIKPTGRRDSLADCPDNPIVDNANECTIKDINKDWYIMYAKQKLSDFKGVKKLEEYKVAELKEMAKEMNIELPPKALKRDIVEIIKQRKEVNEMATKKVEKVEKEETNVSSLNVFEKISLVKNEIRKHNFVMDQVMPSNLGSREYASVGQYYNVLHDACEKNRLFFKWESADMLDFEKDAFKPAGKLANHVTTIRCFATFTNIDAPNETVSYTTIASGSDICDKGASGASTLAFRNWFDKNFTPSYLNNCEDGDAYADDEETTKPPVVPAYVPETKKEQIIKEVVKTVQKEESDDEDIKRIISNIMKVRELNGKAEWGAATLETLMKGEISSADIVAIDLKVQNKLETLEGDNE